MLIPMVYCLEVFDRGHVWVIIWVNCHVLVVVGFVWRLQIVMVVLYVSCVVFFWEWKNKWARSLLTYPSMEMSIYR